MKPETTPAAPVAAPALAQTKKKNDNKKDDGAPVVFFVHMDGSANQSYLPRRKEISAPKPPIKVSRVITNPIGTAVRAAGADS